MNLKEDLVKLIKVLVREELKKSAKTLIKEAVTAEVNAILAEKFVASLANKSVVTEVVGESRREAAPQISRKQQAEARKAELLKKMGADSNSSLGYLFEDVEIPTAGMTITPDGQYIDDEDDEGIDLSQFGVR